MTDCKALRNAEIDPEWKIFLAFIALIINFCQAFSHQFSIGGKGICATSFGGKQRVGLGCPGKQTRMVLRSRVRISIRIK